jgi:hypothetical protein
VVNSNYGPISHGLAVILIIKSFFALFARGGHTCSLIKFEPLRNFELGFHCSKENCLPNISYAATIDLSCTTGQLYA